MENKITVLILAVNEEDVIGDAIKSVKDLADEVIVVDGGSTDKTIQIAEKLDAKIVKNPFKNFADQRNLALTAAHNSWIFYLDADERVTSEFITELKGKIDLFNEDNNNAGFYVRRKTFYYGQALKL